MTVGEIAAGLRLDDKQFTAAAKSSEGLIVRLGDTVRGTADRINRTVIAPDHGPFKSFVHNIVSLSHLAQFAVIGSFKAIAKNAGKQLEGTSRIAALSIAGIWTGFAASVGKS